MNCQLYLGMSRPLRRHGVDDAVEKLVTPRSAIRPGEIFIDGHFVVRQRCHDSNFNPLPRAG
jgi:hypothetical protein